MNRATLRGICGSEPELRSSKNGLSYTTFSLATHKKIKDSDDVSTQWHNIICFGHVADSVHQAVKKGMKLIVDGEIQYSQYEKDGVKRTSTKINASDVAVILGGPKNDASSKPKEFNTPQASKGFITHMNTDFDEEEIPF